MLALSDTAIAGIFVLAGVLVTAVSAVAVALIGRESKRVSDKTTSTVSEFEAAWAAMQEERQADRKRIAVLEEREDNCLEALALSQARIAVLEERLGVTSGE